MKTRPGAAIPALDASDADALRLDAGTIRWFRETLRAWGAEHLRDFPWRRTNDPYRIFLAEFLLQQTDAPRVIPAYHALLAMYPTLADLATTDVGALTEILHPLGLRYRAPRLIRAAQLLANDPTRRGTVPDDEAALLALPGVGWYMARSIRANAYGHPIAVLDTNVARILMRFFGAAPRRTRARDDPYLWDVAQRAAPEQDVGQWNLALIDFGTAVCTARNPGCPACPLRPRCVYGLQVTGAAPNACGDDQASAAASSPTS